MEYPIVTTQPQGMVVSQMNQRMWSSGTFGCFDDTGSCILGCICPLILAMRVAGDMDESVCVPCCVPGSSIVMRTKIRTMYNIQGSIMDDCLLSVCCPACVICQMAREIYYVKREGTQ